MDEKKIKLIKLVETKIPQYLNTYKNGNERFSMSDAMKKGTGVRNVHKKLCDIFSFRECEKIKGAYIFIESGKPVYVGISQNIASRLIQHVKGNTHYSASLAFRIACKDMDVTDTNRNALMKDTKFKRAFKSAKDKIASFDAVVIEIIDPIEKYLFEIYAAMELDTLEYNDFETH